MGKLQDKVTVVVGSTRGNGKGIALACGREGARVVVVARADPEPGLPGTIEATVAEIRRAGGNAFGVTCDITKAASVAAMVDTVLRQAGRIDILINSAVKILYESTLETSEAQWDYILP